MGVLSLLLLLNILPLLFSFASASIFDAALPPILSPIIGKACDGVACGKGNCTVSSNQTLGFSCECDEGWKQFHVGDQLRFMPCVIPDCDIDYSCEGAAPPAAAPPPSRNQSFFDPCAWSYCGGGTCKKTSTLGHRCDCQTGYSNLLNITNFPCFSQCSLGATCAKLGIGLTNSSSSTQPRVSNSGSAENQAWSGLSGNLLWLIGIMISLFMVPGAQSETCVI